MTAPGVATSFCGGGLSPPAVPNLFAFLISNKNKTTVDVTAGTGDTISAPVANVQTLTDAAAPFATDDLNQRINIAGASNAQNNGDWWVSSVAGVPGAIGYLNPTGVLEAGYTGNWTLPGKYSKVVDLQNAREFAQTTPANRPAQITSFSSFPTFGKAPNSAPIHLGYNNAAVAGFEGVDVSLSIRFRTPSLIDSSTFCEITDGTTNNIIRFGVANTTGALFIVRREAGSPNTLLSTATIAINTWYTLGFKLNFAAKTLTANIDGIDIATTAAGLARNPTGLTTISWGRQTTPGGVDEYYSTAFAAGNTGWSAANFLDVHNSFLAFGVPT